MRNKKGTNSWLVPVVRATQRNVIAMRHGSGKLLG